MTQQEKIEAMRLASSISGMAFQHHHLDLLISNYDLICSKGFEVKMEDLLQVKSEVERRAANAQANQSKLSVTE